MTVRIVLVLLAWTFAIAKAAPWEVRQDGARIVFTQELAGPREWGYRYVKTVALTRDQPILTIAHTLTNTGKKPIETDHYCHNMFIFDRQPISRQYRVSFGFPPEAVKPNPKLAQLQDCELRFAADVLKGSFWSPFTGYAAVEQNAFTVLHEPSGLSLKVAPGEAVAWTTTHVFGAP